MRLDARGHFVIIRAVANPDGRALLDSRGGPYRPGADDTGTAVLPTLRPLSQRGPDGALPLLGPRPAAPLRPWSRRLLGDRVRRRPEDRGPREEAHLRRGRHFFRRRSQGPGRPG